MTSPETYTKPSDPHLTAGRKALLIIAVRSGTLLLPDVLFEHNISPEEWLQWNADYDKGGIQDLRTTRIVHRRRKEVHDLPRKAT